MLATLPPIDLPPMMSGPRRTELIDGRQIFGVQRLGAGRRLAAFRRPAARHIAELEARDTESGRGERLRRRVHRGRIHRRAGAMREQDGEAGILGAVEEKVHRHQPADFCANCRSTNCMPRAAVRAHSERAVEFEVARPPPARLGEIAGVELQLRQVEDRVGVGRVERDRLLQMSARRIRRRPGRSSGRRG